MPQPEPYKKVEGGIQHPRRTGAIVQPCCLRICRDGVGACCNHGYFGDAHQMDVWCDVCKARRRAQP